MKRSRVAGHVFSGCPTFNAVGDETQLTLVISAGTSREVITELQEATELEILDDIGREVLGVHKLYGWRKLEFFSMRMEDYYAITWATVSQRDVRAIEKKITSLEESRDNIETESKQLSMNVDDISDAVFDLAAVLNENTSNIGITEEDTSDLQDAVLELAEIINEMKEQIREANQ